MPAQLESANEAVLDLCIDSLLAGRDWTTALPAEEAPRAELAALMEVAGLLVRAAALTGRLQAAQKARVWRRLEAGALKRSRIKAIALYRLPHLPPLWIRPEAC